MQQDSYSNNNNISLIGTVASDKVFSHEVYGEGFYNFTVEVERLSEASDILPVTISERIIDKEKFAVGETVYICGQIRSYNNYIESEGRNKLILTIFVRDMEILDGEIDRRENGDGEENENARYFRNPNDVRLNGYICKPPIYRTTPFGREIADILIAVNRSYNKSDYIPCIAWGRNARFSGKLAVGDNIRVLGRMQSRVYQKKLDETTFIEKTAYEVSISKLELADYAEDSAQKEDQPE